MRYQSLRPRAIPREPEARESLLPPRGEVCGSPETVVVSLGKTLVRYGVDHLLEGSGMAYSVQHCDDPQRLPECLSSGTVSLLLTDAEGLRALSGSGFRADPIKTLLITPQQHPGESAAGLSASVCGMLSESEDAARLKQLVEAAVGCRKHRMDDDDCGRCALKATLRAPELPLSPREIQIFNRIGEGAGPMRIAEEMGLSVKTVESYRDKIKQKLQLQGRDALLLASMRWRAGYYIDGVV